MCSLPTPCICRRQNAFESGNHVRPLSLYLLGTGSWFAAFGIQSVLFTWLVAMVLQESPVNVGVAQMAFLLPSTLLLLIGGSMADRFGARTMVIRSQFLALLPLGALLFMLFSDALTFNGLLAYAICMGTVQAFVTPARDGLLNQVAGAGVQRAVVVTSMVQFGVQMLGLGASMLTDWFGPEPLVFTQMLVLLIGVFAYARIPRSVDHPEGQVAPALSVGAGEPLAAAPREPIVSAVLRSLREGASTVYASAAMRSVIVMNVAMGLFFMGSYIVATPLLIREFYSSDTSALAGLNAANSLGLFLMVWLILRLGTVARPGRALLLAQWIGGLILALGVFPMGYWVFTSMIFVWGLCGGVAMSMSRSVMQELAPPGQRARVMSFYSLALMGAGPMGALWAGYLCEQIGPRQALMVNGLSMTVLSSVMYLARSLVELRSPSEQPS